MYIAVNFDNTGMCIQMKWLIRDKLASWLRMRVPSKTSMPSPAGSRRNSSHDTKDLEEDGQQPQEIALGKTNKLLMEILLHLQRANVRSAADDPDVNDWKLAAAVIDRILCIVFSILFIGGSVLFFTTFAIGYYSNS